MKYEKASMKNTRIKGENEVVLIIFEVSKDENKVYECKDLNSDQKVEWILKKNEKSIYIIG